MFPTDAKLLNRARKRLAKEQGIVLLQSYTRVGKFALIKHQRYAHGHLSLLKNQIGFGIGAPVKIASEDCLSAK
ncbi:MAG TPA: hypothetical protein DCG89_07310 [Spartobacteria bacterium]|jgi:hypothetical protein|nr:hypothetical protein [Spartobacteria bacterium]